MLGTDGANVSDQHKYNDPSSDRKPIDTMVDMLETSHMAPTAPDTLYSYPFPDRDPFVLESTPHVYFAGCQDEFSTQLLEAPGVT